MVKCQAKVIYSAEVIAAAGAADAGPGAACWMARRAAQHLKYRQIIHTLKFSLIPCPLAAVHTAAGAAAAGQGAAAQCSAAAAGELQNHDPMSFAACVFALFLQRSTPQPGQPPPGKMQRLDVSQQQTAGQPRPGTAGAYVPMLGTPAAATQVQSLGCLLLILP